MAAFPNVEFQALLTEIASLKPDAVACMFAGAAAGKFMKDYAAAGLQGKIPLWGSGFLTEGVLEAAGPAAEGVMTTMHYSDSLDTARNNAFRTEYAKMFKAQPDVYSVQGYDAGLLLLAGAKAVLINVTGGTDMTLLEVDEAANVISDQVDPDGNIIDVGWMDPTAAEQGPPSPDAHAEA